MKEFIKLITIFKQGLTLEQVTYSIIGLSYTHQRQDRDEHIIIRLEDVIPDQIDYDFQTEIVEYEDLEGNMYDKYDYSSILHPPYYVS